MENALSNLDKILVVYRDCPGSERRVKLNLELQIVSKVTPSLRLGCFSLFLIIPDLTDTDLYPTQVVVLVSVINLGAEAINWD